LARGNEACFNQQDVGRKIHYQLWAKETFQKRQVHMAHSIECRSQEDNAQEQIVTQGPLPSGDSVPPMLVAVEELIWC
jgi:hypothetical protein